MSKDVLAKRYAKAFFESQPSLKKVIQTHKDLETLVSLYEASHHLQVFFLSPNFIPQEKIAFINQAAQREGWQKATVRFLRLLIEKNRIRSIKDVAQALGHLIDEAQGKKRVTIMTARRLSDGEKVRIRNRMRSIASQEVEIEVEVDPGLIGGVYIQVGSKVFDGTIQGKLEALTGRLVKGV